MPTQPKPSYGGMKSRAHLLKNGGGDKKYFDSADHMMAAQGVKSARGGTGRLVPTQHSVPRASFGSLGNGKGKKSSLVPATVPAAATATPAAAAAAAAMPATEPAATAVAAAPAAAAADAAPAAAAAE